MAQQIKTKNNYGLPIAIIIGGLFIAGAVFWSNGNASRANTKQANPQQAPVREPNSEFRLPNESDHVRGNREAKVTVVEFSDFQCPFCARFHPTLKQLVNENSEVKWVFRHFPLSSHSRAFGAAVASECIAKLGGQDAFWNFADAAFANQNRLGRDWYEEVARTSNITVETFRTCLKDGVIAKKVQTDLDEAVAEGGRGTPFAVVVTASGKLRPLSGALPYEQIKSLVDQARNN